MVKLPAKYNKTNGRLKKWRTKVKQDEQLRLTRELVFNDKIVLVEAMGLAPALDLAVR